MLLRSSSTMRYIRWTDSLSTHLRRSLASIRKPLSYAHIHTWIWYTERLGFLFAPEDSILFSSGKCLQISCLDFPQSVKCPKAVHTVSLSLDSKWVRMYSIWHLFTFERRFSFNDAHNVNVPNEFICSRVRTTHRKCRTHNCEWYILSRIRAYRSECRCVSNKIYGWWSYRSSSSHILATGWLHYYYFSHSAVLFCKMQCPTSRRKISKFRTRAVGQQNIYVLVSVYVYHYM